MRLFAGLVAFVLLQVTPTLAACGANSAIGEYEIGVDGERVWCGLSGAASIWQTVVATVASLFDFAEAVGGGKTALGALALAVIGIFITGSQRMRVRTYRNDVLIGDEIQGGVQGLTQSRFLRLIGNLLKIAGIVMFIVGTLDFASHIHL